MLLYNSFLPLPLSNLFLSISDLIEDLDFFLLKLSLSLFFVRLKFSLLFYMYNILSKLIELKSVIVN